MQVKDGERKRLESKVLVGYLCVIGVRRLGGLLVAGNQEMFTKEDMWLVYFMVAVKLKRSDGLEVVVTSIYGLGNATL